MLQISVFNSRQHIQRCIDSAAVTIGSGSSSSKSRHVQISDNLVSEQQCRLELVHRDGAAKLELLNLGSCVVLGDGNRLHQGISDVLDLPCSIYAGDSQIEVSVPVDSEDFDNELKRIPVIGSAFSEEAASSQDPGRSPAPATLNSWFEALSLLHRSTASQSGFYKLAARAVFNPGGLDGCIILKKDGDQWDIVSQHLPFPDYGIAYRSDLVQRAAETASILYHPSMSQQAAKNCSHKHSAVVCPIREEDGNITAMVYGFRCNHRRNNRCGIRDLEAKFVSLIADAVSAGLIRLSREASGARRRVLLEQAFSPRVAERLENNPDFPVVENREVTVLFADIRRFCVITEKLGCHLTYHLLSDVMDRFTAIIHQHDGVVIDYYGDGISAFWNAPVAQPDHALLACRAAMEITKSLDDLNATWSDKIGQKLRVGIGVTTGQAQIGNSGSSTRLKYGPQGTTVNIASRLEQSTKKTGVSFVVSGTTAERVQSEFIGHRICTASFTGINQNVEVFQLFDVEDSKKHEDFITQYQATLSLFESHKILEAIENLMAMIQQYPNRPLLEFLLSRAVERMNAIDHENELVNQAIQTLGTSVSDTVEVTNALAM